MEKADLSGGLKVKDLAWVKERVALAEKLEALAKDLYPFVKEDDDDGLMDVVEAIVKVGKRMNRCSVGEKEGLNARAFLETVEKMRLLELDHDPEGWPAVRMKDITMLCDGIDSLRRSQNRLTAEMRKYNNEKHVVQI